MKKIYKSPCSRPITLDCESVIMTLSNVDGNTTPIITDKGDIDAGDAMTNKQNSLWDSWND